MLLRSSASPRSEVSWPGFCELLTWPSIQPAQRTGVPSSLPSLPACPLVEATASPSIVALACFVELCVCVCTPQTCSLCWTSNNECLKVATHLPHMPCRLLLPLFSHCKPQMGLSPYASVIDVHRGTSHFCNLLAVCSWHVRPHR